MSASTVTEGPAGPLEVHVQGEGPCIVMLPSLGRGAADFALVAETLAGVGYRVVCPEPRGFGRSTATLGDLTMNDLAADVAAVIETICDGEATVVGHAFGNRVARLVATVRPDLVESVVLLACGGLVAPAPVVAAALRAVFDEDLSDEEHLEAVRLAFFAPGNDPSLWADGWSGAVALAQAGATQAMPTGTWWGAGSAEVLVVQPDEDVIAVTENADRIVEELGERATLVTIPEAGHALLPEQPEAVATAILCWLAR